VSGPRQITGDEEVDVMGTVASLLCAWPSGDEAGFELALDGFGRLDRLVAWLIGQLDAQGAHELGRAEWNARCRAWQPGQRLGDDPGGYSGR
jgi:hypothetical protein